MAINSAIDSVLLSTAIAIHTARAEFLPTHRRCCILPETAGNSVGDVVADGDEVNF